MAYDLCGGCNKWGAGSTGHASSWPEVPGVLIQGDSLSRLCAQADEACVAAKGSLDPDAYDELRNALRHYLTHYKTVLGEHQIPLPFSGS